MKRSIPSTVLFLYLVALPKAALSQRQFNKTFVVKSMSSTNPEPSCHLGQFTGIESEPILAAETRSSRGLDWVIKQSAGK